MRIRQRAITGKQSPITIRRFSSIPDGLSRMAADAAIALRRVKICMPALSDCNEALRLQPLQTLASTNRGFIHLKLGDTTQAIADFDTAITTDTNNAWSLYGRGLAKW